MWRWRRPGSIRCRCITRSSSTAISRRFLYATQGTSERAGTQDRPVRCRMAGAPARMRAAGWLVHSARGDQSRTRCRPLPHQALQSRTSELQRLGNVLQDAGIKVDSVASTITAKSVRAMVEALIDGERRPRCSPSWRRAGCARKSPIFDGVGRPLRRPPCLDVSASSGPRRPSRGDDRSSRLPDRGHDAPLSGPARPVDHDPWHRSVRRRSGPLRDRRRHPRVLPRAAHLASWAGLCPGNHESAGKRHSGKPRHGNSTSSRSWSSAPGRRSATRATSDPSTTGTS